MSRIRTRIKAPLLRGFIVLAGFRQERAWVNNPVYDYSASRYLMPCAKYACLIVLVLFFASLTLS
jgi:hypothetical protein